MAADRTYMEYLITITFCLLFISGSYTNSVTRRSSRDHHNHHHHRQPRVAFACVGQLLQLDCPSVGHRIQVQSVVVADSRCYKFTGVCCPDTDDCSGTVEDGRREALAAECDGRTSCSVPMETRVLPCPSFGRSYNSDYENVTYVCRPVFDRPRIDIVIRSNKTESATKNDTTFNESSSSLNTLSVVYTPQKRDNESRAIHLVVSAVASMSLLLNCVLIAFAVVAAAKLRKRRRQPAQGATPSEAPGSTQRPICGDQRRDGGTANGGSHSGLLEAGVSWYEPLRIGSVQGDNGGGHSLAGNHRRVYINDIRPTSLYQDIN